MLIREAAKRQRGISEQSRLIPDKRAPENPPGHGLWARPWGFYGCRDETIPVFVHSLEDAALCSFQLRGEEPGLENAGLKPALIKRFELINSLHCNAGIRGGRMELLKGRHSQNLLSKGFSQAGSTGNVSRKAWDEKSS